MMHSMDFHSAMVSPQDKYRSVAPGQTISYEFTPNYPGVFMYHCGTPMVLEHIASGMYGMMIVEPRDGYPTKVDREYAVIQSEFYTKLDPQKRKVDGAPLYVLDGERVRAKAPTYTVFNGRYNGFVDKPLPAKPGERVRLFVLNVGPSNTSSFHVVGTIFDRVWIDGNPDNQMRGMQTVLLGSSSGAITEFVVPEAGSYVMVDHHFANASQGAIGLIKAGGKPEERRGRRRAPQHPGHGRADRCRRGARQAVVRIEVPRVPFDRRRRQARARTSTRSRSGATEAWLVRWLKTPEQMLASRMPRRSRCSTSTRCPCPTRTCRTRRSASTSRTSSGPMPTCGRKATTQPQPAAPGTARNPSETLSATPMPSRTSQRQVMSGASMPALRPAPWRCLAPATSALALRRMHRGQGRGDVRPRGRRIGGRARSGRRVRGRRYESGWPQAAGRA